jgi:hypothetical protein
VPLSPSEARSGRQRRKKRQMRIWRETPVCEAWRSLRRVRVESKRRRRITRIRITAPRRTVVSALPQDFCRAPLSRGKEALGRNMLAHSARRPFPGRAPCAFILIPVSSTVLYGLVIDHSDTGERPFVCKEPSCRRRFSVQSNLKRHAKVHQLGAQNGGPPLHQPGPSHPINGGVSRPIERSHRHSIPPHPVGQGFYHPHHPGPHQHLHPHAHPRHPSQAHGHPGFTSYPPPPGYGHEQGYRPPRPQDVRAGKGGPQRVGPGFSEEGWEDEEDELEEDELDEENDEEEKV